MKTLACLFIALATLSPMQGQESGARPGTKSLAEDGCANNSFSPEIYTFYGDAATIAKKLERVDADLPKRRIYAFVVETADTIEVSLYEKSGDKEVTVKRWSTKAAAGLGDSINRAIIDNKGVNCVGEQVKSVLSKSLGNAEKAADEKVAAPASLKAAIGHLSNKAKDKYQSVSVILLC